MSVESIYYRWRVYSFLQGDNLNSWRTDPFNIVCNGIKYKPPPVVSYSNMRNVIFNINSNIVSQNGNIPLSASERIELESLLSNSSLSRDAVCRAMMYIIDHSNSAYDVTNTFISCILGDNNDVNLMVFRLYILSDVLYNSSCSHQFAWIYRTSFERRIPEIFEHIRRVRKRITSKIASQQLLDSAIKILQVWRSWIIYPQLFTNGLEAILLGDDFTTFQTLPEFDTNKHLMTENDGVPIPFNEFLSKLPLKWRTTAYKYLSLSMKDLKNTCHHHGLSNDCNERELLVMSLIIFNKYWSDKVDNDQTNNSEDMDHSDVENDVNNDTSLSPVHLTTLPPKDALLDNAVNPSGIALRYESDVDSNMDEDTSSDKVHRKLQESDGTLTEEDIDDMFA